MAENEDTGRTRSEDAGRTRSDRTRDDEQRAVAEGTPEHDPGPDRGGQYLDEGGYNEGHDREDPGNPLWDESLIALLLVGGLVLLLFPEPGTSAVGAILLAVGVLAWLVDAIN